jgi:Glyoxalase/Bleomycin resistance protein/Dioxygenase superfamily
MTSPHPQPAPAPAAAAPGHPLAPTRLVQLAYRVDDLDAACHDWAQTLGVGPFLVRRRMAVTVTHRGEPAQYLHSAAFGQWGPLMVELIQVHECAPASLSQIVHHDRVGQPHHLASFVADLDGTAALLQASGVEVAMDLVSSSGIRTLFLDARATTGCLLELYSPNDHLRALYDRVRDLAAGWDGLDVVREL